MVIVRLMGGMGNQMFQYAAGRRLALVNNTNLKLDLDGLNSISELETPRHYELGPFAIQEDFASAQEVARLRKGRDAFFKVAARRFATNINPFYRPSHIIEKHYHVDPTLLKLRGDVYLEGYWQSEKYFKDVEEIIRKEFSVRTEPTTLNRQFMEKIKNTEAVSIHVRRGDYVSRATASAFHGTCSQDYYASAMEKIISDVAHPHFFVFSDDPAWAQENLRFSCVPTFLDHNSPDKGYEDLRLMTFCKHHIIANSSFSWWGAWLGSDLRKIVIAPKRWFNDESINTADLLPETWIRM